MNQQAVEAIRKRWTWKPLHWKPLPSDEELAAILEAARPHIEAEALVEAADAMDADSAFRDPLRLKSEWVRDRAQQIVEGEQ